MRRRIVTSLAVLGAFAALSAQEKPSEQFWNELQKHCGKAYEGTVTRGAKEGDQFSGELLLMQVLDCKENGIKIPFYVGEDSSRTWVLTRGTDGRLKLKHDYRLQDGTPDKVTQYGGQSTNYGFKTQQIFPADLETANLIAYASGNVWWIDLDEKSFSYSLRRIGQDRVFTVRFDLTRPVETTRTPWGWDK